MKILNKIMRVVFFPIFWMIDMKKILDNIYLVTRKNILLNIGECHLSDEEKNYLIQNIDTTFPKEKK